MALCYHEAFLSQADARRLQTVLLSDVRWRQETLHLYGRPARVPRLLAWCGDAGLNYRYSGLDHSCCGWFDALLPIRDRLADVFGLQTNLVLLNRYRDGSDHMGWHRDDERGHGPRVASLSLGATRRFLVRVPGEDRSRRIDLAAGSLLIMDGRLRHRLPPTRQPVDERINLTFRHIGSVTS